MPSSELHVSPHCKREIRAVVCFALGAPRKEMQSSKYPELKPVATTDENGRWVALNVKTGRYCVLFFDPNHQTLALSEADFTEIKKGAVTIFPTKEPPKIRRAQLVPR